MDKILEDMLNKSLSNFVLDRIQEGKLIVDNAIVYILHDNDIYYLVDVPYKEGMDKKTKKSIAMEFINKYSYIDIVNLYHEKENNLEKNIK